MYMEENRRKDGFVGEKQINIPTGALNTHIVNVPFKNALYITHIGYFPNANFHYRKREQGCEDYILIYCLDGRGHYETPKGSFTLEYNQFILLPPDQFHSYWADLENPWTICWVHLNGSMLNEMNGNFKLEQFESPTALPYNNQILELWNEMYSSLSEGYTEENLVYANLCLYRFVSFFLFPSRVSKLQVEHKREDQLEKSISFMKANIHKRLTVDELAKEFNYSPSHYATLFKQKEGLSPIDYFIRIKIRYACQLLSNGNLIVKEVAEKIGYDDPYYFSRIFKKVTGKSPQEYKIINLKNSLAFSGRTEELATAI
ncbi:AraC family transcriptional regulator [Solitalea lacus]|uniref:AraC family transcriptional regulator n=1 Tax=Solitalea lacus TaxID=2911172 RepID=UPI001EDB6AB6|nr:AraC family transcriptional regulator [Solitalea lacus]UKJ09321.1 AraC family transcriptional regulator [Solitalea lacus]